MVLRSLWPEADRSRFRVDWPGGGGKAGDLGCCGECWAIVVDSIVEEDGSAASGEETNPICSVIGAGRSACGVPAMSGVSGEYGGGGEGIAAGESSVSI
jgi:hypothetical protein